MSRSFDLSLPIDDNDNHCSRYVRVREDAEVPGRVFFQKSGTLVVDATSDQLNGTVKGTLTNPQ